MDGLYYMGTIKEQILVSLGHPDIWDACMISDRFSDMIVSPRENILYVITEIDINTVMQN